MSTKLYEETFQKETKLKQLASKVNIDTGLTFKPKVNEYKAPKHVKLLTVASKQLRQIDDVQPIDYVNLNHPLHPQNTFDTRKSSLKSQNT